MKEKINKLYNLNFLYSLNYNYDGYHECPSYGCDEEGICRCYKITDVYIDQDSINLIEITDKVHKFLFGGDDDDLYTKREKTINALLETEEEDITRYFINRLLTINKFYDKKNWEVEWSGSYYGDEIDSIHLDNDLKLRQSLLHINDSNKDKIEHLLTEEYGHLNKKLQNKKWKVDIINKDQLSFGSNEHYENVSTGYYNDSEYNLPRGIVLKDGDTGMYRVFDGYHRLKNSTSDVVEVIIAY